MIFSVEGTRLATAILLAFGTVAKAQEEVVIDLRTREARLASAEALRQIAIGEKQAAEAVARQNNWPIRGTTIDGGVFELVRLENGHPIYYTTHNVNAAISTGVDLIRNISPYNVNGAGILVGVWDGGSVLSTHQEVTGRVNIGDGSASHWHATHVGGTIGASGVNSDALGMAPSVSISSWDWTSDTSEMTGIAASSPGQASRIYLSNHSYGSINGWSTGNWSGNQGPHYWGASGEREDNKFGRYNSGAASWDSLAFSSQYYLIFKSAGNDRNDAAPAAGATYYFLNGGWQTATYNAATGPFNDGFDNGGFDTISTEGVAKNIMTIGAANDAVAGGLRSVAAGTMSSFSGWGPADDGRIKPDIVANGVGLTSAHDSSNTAYSGSSGTSMSSPNACGSALLLTEYYSDLFSNGAMRASTLKGLIIHTADDVGNAGPDYSYGWGYMNAKTAADHIKRHSDFPTAFFMVESILNSGTPTETYQLRWNGVDPMKVTICWTDPAGPAQTTLDNTTPVLVNDLDIRITTPASQTVMPFILNVASPAALATTGDNTVDNVEQLNVATPTTGVYTLTVSHKNSLSGGQQRYSLIISGQSDNPVPVAEIGVFGNGTAIASGDTTPATADGTDFGGVDIGASITNTFVITNTGNVDLDITGVSFSGAAQADYSVVTQPAAAVTPLGSTTLGIAFSPSAAGARDATVSIANNDTDENPYTFDVTGNGDLPREIAILGNGVEIAAGDTTPSTTDGTDFGAADILTATSTQTFTITNSGNANLTITPPVAILGQHAADFLLLTAPGTTIAASNYTTFQIQFDPSAAGFRNATLYVTNNDANENPYNFDIVGEGVVAPEISISGNGQEIVSGDVTPSAADHTHFGSVNTLGATFSRTYTITNSGSGPLSVSSVVVSGANASEFVVTTSPASAVAAGSSTTFVVTFDPTAPGSRIATVSVASTDPDENPYTFAIEGNGIVQPDVRVFGNGVEIANNDLTPDPADHTDFGDVAVVSASFARVFTITNSGSGTLTLSAVPSITGVAAADYSLSSPPFLTIAQGESTTFTIDFDPSLAGARNATITINSDDPDDPTFTYAITGNGAEPEVAVLGNGLEIVDGDITPIVADGTDFGTLDVLSGSVTHTFVITNSGDTNLLISAGVTITGPAAADFTIALAPASSIVPGGFSQMQVRYDPVGTGTRTATLSFANNDSDETPYGFVIQGNATGPELDIFGNNFPVDDGSTVPNVTNLTQFGVGNIGVPLRTNTFVLTNNGTGTITLSLPVVSAGAAALDFAIVRQPGTDSLAAGEGTTMDIAFTPRGGGSRLAFIVITNDDVDEAVYDFAVGGTGLGPEIELLGNGEIITNQTPTTSFTNHTEFGAADITAGFIDRVFTITNSGTTNLYPGSISFIGAAASDFTVLTNPPASIATNDSAPFAVRFNPSGVGTRSATIQINSDDFDESPYQFAVSGSGFAIPPLPQQQPVGRNVNALETVSFVFLVSGTPTITYQWFRNGVEIPGATSATLTYIQVTGDEAGNYKCVASNAAGSLTSDEVALNVALLPTAVNWSTPPSIVYGTPLGAAQLNATATAAGTITYTPPAGTFLAAGSTDVTANFTPTLANVYLPSSRIVSVTVTPAPLTITADDKSILLGGSIPALTATHSGLVAGDTPASLTTQANLSTTATGSSPVGSYPITISGATSPNYTIMHVIGTLTVFANAPTVDAAPASQTILQGANASFTVLASGTAPLSYQWRKNGVDIPGATTTTLNINNAQSVDEASYDVVITNVGGSVTSAAATLTFSIPPTIITQPQSQTFGALSDVIFTVATAGTTPLSYQWSKDGVDIPGATSSILFLSGVTTNDIGSYRVKVTNVAGMVDSDAAALSVNQLGSGLTWNAPADVPYGTLLNAAQLSAFAAVPGTTAYTPAAGTLLSVGAHTLSVVFTPNDLVNFVPETNTVTLNVTNKILNIIAEGKSREINVPNPALTATFSGFIAGEDTNVLTALPVLSTTADINSFAGLYPITVSGATAPNYQIVFVPSTLTVFANAPSFVTQPASLGVTNGVDVTLFAQTAGSQPQGFQWRLNGTNLPGENATNIVITNIQPALGGLYDVVVSNVAGVVTSELASVVVYVPPAITTPPQSVTVNALTTTTLNVSASGTSPLLFQWKKNGLDILNATNTTLSFPAITSNDAGTYSVAVSNIAGFDISAGALLTVDQLTPSLSWVTPGSITYGTALSTNQLNAAASVPGTFTYTPPLGTFLSAGTHALTVEFQPTDTLNYATNSSTVNINVDPATLVITANSATREFGLANPALTAQFVGFVLGEGPADLATPLVLSITGDVNSGLGAYPITATGASSPNYNITHIDGTLTVFGNQPSVVTPPAPATVSEGSPVGFAVVATGTAPLSYQWRRNGQNIADATNTIYNISSAQPSDAGGYDVVISNVAGVTTSSSATLVVNSPPAITSQPQAQALHVGMTAQFSVLATGSGTLNYQWRKDGVNLPGANAASLSVPGVSTLSAGNYDVVISNVAGSITSSAVALTVDSAPLLAVGPASQSTTASLQLVTLSSTSFGAQPITYYWRHNGLLRTGAGFSGPNVSFINFTTNLGLWELTISNSFGTAVSAPAYVTTPGAPSVLGQPQDATVLEGQTVTFSMLPNGSQPFRVQWLKDGQFLANASGLSLTISNVTALDAGGYTAVIGNTFGFSSSQPATLSVIVPPVILTQPAHQLISVGGVASFGVNVSSVEAVTYQWRKDGSNLVGQTTSGVSVANAQPVDAGNYDVIVANSAGSVTSSVANLTLANPPVLTTQPTSTAVEVATRVELVSLASGSAPLHYQWRLNGVDLFGRTNATMILLSAGRLDRGLYTVWVSNAVGTVESTNASLVVREQQMVETPKLEANGRFAFTFGDKSGGSLTPDLAPNFLIQASSNLIDWITISSNGAGMVYTNGQFRFVDLEAPKKVFRYYRIIEP